MAGKSDRDETSDDPTARKSLQLKDGFVEAVCSTFKRDKPMLKCGGRPVAIDATGLKELSETLQVNLNMARDLLHAEINRKRLPTVMRRFNYVVQAVAVKDLSRRSLR